MKISKTFLILGVVFILGVLGIIFLLSGKQKPQNEQASVVKIEPADQICQEDVDCTIVVTDCLCDCKNLAPINNVHKEKYNSLFSGKCGDNSSWQVCKYCCPFTLKCLGNKCSFVEAPEICD